MHDRLFCLDVETVPDLDLVPDDWGDAFPKLPWHRVVAISVVEATIEQVDGLERYRAVSCRSGGEPDWDEARLLRAFWRSLSERPTRLVTWNGRGFDVPVLKLRSMVHGLSAEVWTRSGTRWDNYAHRYATEWHCDLMEVLSDHGAAQRLPLHEVAMAMGFPGKMGGSGSEVRGMWDRGEIDRIRAYCECDVLNTFGVYVRWALLTGRTDRRNHDYALETLADALDRVRGDRPMQGEFLDAWASRKSAAAASFDTSHRVAYGLCHQDGDPRRC